MDDASLNILLEGEGTIKKHSVRMIEAGRESTAKCAGGDQEVHARVDVLQWRPFKRKREDVVV